MTIPRDQLLRRLVDLQEMSRGDAEAAHGEADDLLLAYLNDVEITAAYRMIERWYA